MTTEVPSVPKVCTTGSFTDGTLQVPIAAVEPVRIEIPPP
jgi:hypothetical protein